MLLDSRKSSFNVTRVTALLSFRGGQPKPLSRGGSECRMEAQSIVGVVEKWGDGWLE